MPLRSALVIWSLAAAGCVFSLVEIIVWKGETAANHIQRCQRGWGVCAGRSGGGGGGYMRCHARPDAQTDMLARCLRRCPSSLPQHTRTCIVAAAAPPHHRALGSSTSTSRTRTSAAPAAAQRLLLRRSLLSSGALLACPPAGVVDREWASLMLHPGPSGSPCKSLEHFKAIACPVQPPPHPSTRPISHTQQQTGWLASSGNLRPSAAAAAAGMSTSGSGESPTGAAVVYVTVPDQATGE